MKYFALFCLLACVQSTTLTKGKPSVVAAQRRLYEYFLDLQTRVLHDSLDVSRLAQATTKAAYHLSYEAENRLESMLKSFHQETMTIKALASTCVNEESVRKTENYFETVSQKVYACTHGVSNIAASFDTELTKNINAARDRLWAAQKTMIKCQEHKPEEERDCLKRSLGKGTKTLDLLPQEVRAVLNRAQAESEQSVEKLGDCYVWNVSRAEEKKLDNIQKMRKCLHDRLS